MTKKELLEDLEKLKNANDAYESYYEYVRGILFFMNNDDVFDDEYFREKNKNYFYSKKSLLSNSNIDIELGELKGRLESYCKNCYKSLQDRNQELEKNKQDEEKKNTVKSKSARVMSSRVSRRHKVRIVASILLGLFTISLVTLAILEQLSIIDFGNQWFSFSLGIVDLVFGVAFFIYEFIEDVNDNIDIDRMLTGEEDNRKYRFLMIQGGFFNKQTYKEININSNNK